jgi:hypothetical protein
VVIITPINDLDSYWHVLIGRQILSRHILDGLGTGWLAETPPPWQTSQWLSEAMMAVTVGAAGWRGLIALRLLLTASILLVVGLTLLPRRPVPLAALVASVVMVGISDFAQDRPQTVSLLFVAALAWACSRRLTGRRPPHPAMVAAACLLWSQFHPLWVLAPAAYGLMALGAALDGARASHPALREPAVALVASLAGLVNPQGLSSFLLPLRFHSSTQQIAEWQPTTFSSLDAFALATVLGLGIVAWARTPDRVPRAEVLWLCAWTVFGLTAFRNVAPALLLSAPVALAITDRVWGARASSWQRPSGSREATALGVALLLTVIAGTGVAVVKFSRLDPLRDAPARHLAERLAQAPVPVRVFNAYDASGCLAAFGAGRVRLAIDGRADLWGTAYIKKVIDAQSLKPGWEGTFDGFHPDAAVLTRNTPLAVLLVREGTWREVAEDGDYVLLLPATSTAGGAR